MFTWRWKHYLVSFLKPVHHCTSHTQLNSHLVLFQKNTVQCNAPTILGTSWYYPQLMQQKYEMCPRSNLSCLCLFIQQGRYLVTFTTANLIILDPLSWAKARRVQLQGPTFMCAEESITSTISITFKASISAWKCFFNPCFSWELIWPPPHVLGRANMGEVLALGSTSRDLIKSPASTWKQWLRNGWFWNSSPHEEKRNKNMKGIFLEQPHPNLMRQ